MKNLTKIYKENYRHKHTLKYIKGVVIRHLVPKFEFEIDKLYKTLSSLDFSDRIYDDYSLSKSLKDEILKNGNKMHASYTVSIKRERELYDGCDLDDYIDLIMCLKNMSVEFSKRGLVLIPNVIDNNMDFDVVESDKTFYMTLDNYQIFHFLKGIVYNYRANLHRGYSAIVKDDKFYQILLEDSFDNNNECEVKDNIIHFNDFLKSQCVKSGMKCIAVGGSKFNIYTNRQYRMLKVEELLLPGI